MSGKHRDLATRAPHPPTLPGALGDLFQRNRALEAFNEGRTLLLDVDGNGNVITTGLVRRRVAIHFDCVITGWRLLADVPGDVVIDIWKAAYGSYPPTIANTIVAAAPPTLSAVDHAEDTALTGWTIEISAGDVLFFHIDSAATITSLDLSLAIQRT